MAACEFFHTLLTHHTHHSSLITRLLFRAPQARMQHDEGPAWEGLGALRALPSLSSLAFSTHGWHLPASLLGALPPGLTVGMSEGGMGEGGVRDA